MNASPTLPMTRAEPIHPGGPVTADVHPDEVANYQAGGWRLAEQNAQTRKTREEPARDDEGGEVAPTSPGKRKAKAQS